MEEQVVIQTMIDRVALKDLVREIMQEEFGTVTAGMSEKEFAQAVGISERTARRLREDRRIGFLQIGRRIVYLPQHVQEFRLENERKQR